MTKDENVTNFLGGLIELTGMNRVDGDSNKYIRDRRLSACSLFKA